MADSACQLDYAEIVTVKSDSETYCKLCSIASFHKSDFEGALNHLLTNHGYRIIHVGQETDRGLDGPIHRTIAVLGLCQ